MFGQEPWLPVDFLLGRVSDPAGGGVHEWILEHQARLQIAFEGARERLKVAADRRKRNYDRHIHHAPLEVGRLARLRDFSVRGQQKIQDLWGPVVYRVLRAPNEGGSVNTVAPIDDPTKARQVNWTLLKAMVEADPVGGTSAPLPPTSGQPLSEDELSCDGNLLVLGHGAPPAAPIQTTTPLTTNPQLLPAQPLC